MNINVTIFVQMINFCIVYWLLRTFLFKPTIAIIDAETIHKNSLVNLLSQQKKSIEIQEQEREQFWRSCQEYFRAHTPSFSFVTFGKTITTHRHIDTQEITKESDVITKKIYPILEEKIKHVH